MSDSNKLTQQEPEKMVLPSADEIKEELSRVYRKNHHGHMIRIVTLLLATASAVAILVAILLLPILKIYGSSMTPTLYEGNIVLSLKSNTYATGEVVSFYYNNNILVKRVIALQGDWVDIDKDGNVFVNGVQLDEPYVDKLAFGKCDIDLPYQVPDGYVFVMGDHRSTSKDSRSKDIGPIAKEKMVGRIIFKLWPLTEFGGID